MKQYRVTLLNGAVHTVAGNRFNYDPQRQYAEIQSKIPAGWVEHTVTVKRTWLGRETRDYHTSNTDTWVSTAVFSTVASVETVG